MDANRRNGHNQLTELLPPSSGSAWQWAGASSGHPPVAQPESGANCPRQTAPLSHLLSSHARGGPGGPGAARCAGPAARRSRLRGSGRGGSGVPCQAKRPAAAANRTYHPERWSGAAAADWWRGKKFSVNLLLNKYLDIHICTCLTWYLIF